MNQENVKKTPAKLMVPLFNGMNFNKEGVRIRAKYVKTLHIDGVDYPLWVADGKNENNYPKAENDTHYLKVQTKEYLVPCGFTEYGLEQRSGYSHLISEMYGSSEARSQFFSEIRAGKAYEEYDRLVVEQIAKEEAFIQKWGKEEDIQALFLKTAFIDREIKMYIDARDNGGKFASFIGAAFLGESEKCLELSQILKAKRKKEEDIKRAEREEQEKREAEAKAAAELEEIEKAEDVFVHGGVLEDVKLIIKIADKYGVNIPLRTRGWILNSLAKCTISENGSISCRYWKTKYGKGSQKIWDILAAVKDAIQKTKVA